MNNLIIENICVYGIGETAMASGFPMLTDFDDMEFFKDTMQYDKVKKAYERADKLASCKGGESHDCFLCGVVAQFNLTAPRYFCQEWQRYHFQDIISSTSTMHRIKAFVNKACEMRNKIKVMQDDADKDYLNYIYQHFANETDIEIIELFLDRCTDFLQNRTDLDAITYIKSNLPEGFKFTARITTNYRQLKTMYRQRKNHHLQEWRTFCDALKNFPHHNWITGCDE